MDYNDLEALLKEAKRDYVNFIDYLIECTEDVSNTSCLNEYAYDLRLFKDFAIPLKHVLALTILEKIAQKNPSAGMKKLVQFKSKFKEAINDECANLDNLFSYLSENIECGLAKREKTLFVNFEGELSSNENLWDKTREHIFPKEIKRARDFVEIYKEALNDMIYITYKTGGRDRLVAFDGDENHNLAVWVLKNRNYDFLRYDYKDPNTLAFRMWEIISEKRKEGLFD